MKKSEKKLTRGVRHGLLAFLFWEIGYALLGKAVSVLGWEKATLVDVCAGLIALYTLLVFTAKPKLRQGLSVTSFTNKYVLGVASVQLFGGIIFSIGLAHARSVAVITAISATYPALTVFLALKHLGEKRQILTLVGAFTTIIGVIILSI